MTKVLPTDTYDFGINLCPPIPAFLLSDIRCLRWALHGAVLNLQPAEPVTFKSVPQDSPADVLESLLCLLKLSTAQFSGTNSVHSEPTSYMLWGGDPPAPTSSSTQESKSFLYATSFHDDGDRYKSFMAQHTFLLRNLIQDPQTSGNYLSVAVLHLREILETKRHISHTYTHSLSPHEKTDAHTYTPLNTLTHIQAHTPVPLPLRHTLAQKEQIVTFAPVHKEKEKERGEDESE